MKKTCAVVKTAIRTNPVPKLCLRHFKLYLIFPPAQKKNLYSFRIYFLDDWTNESWQTKFK